MNSGSCSQMTLSHKCPIESYCVLNIPAFFFTLRLTKFIAILLLQINDKTCNSAAPFTPV